MRLKDIFDGNKGNNIFEILLQFSSGSRVFASQGTQQEYCGLPAHCPVSRSGRLWASEGRPVFATFYNGEYLGTC
jgi:hypothetical protein